MHHRFEPDVIARFFIAGLALSVLVGCRFDTSGIAITDDANPIGYRDAGPQRDTLRFGDTSTSFADTLPPSRILKLSFKNKDRDQNLSDFPVLVVLDPSRIHYEDAAEGGADLSFFDDDGSTVLPHEVEHWSQNGTSYIWVRVPRIDASSDDDFITMRYGYGRSDAPDPQQVWAAGYLGVYHLADDPDSSPPQIHDSSPGQHHGSTQGNMSASNMVPGQIAGSLAFRADHKDYILLGNIKPFDVDTDESRTLELWFKAPQPSASSYILQKELNCQGWGISLRSDSIVMGRFTVGNNCRGSNQSFHLADYNTNLADMFWHYVAFIIDRATPEARLYIDGKLKATEIIDSNSPASNGVAKIGSTWDDSTTFEGFIDEVRVSEGAHSSHWIDAQYASMTDSFVVYTQQ